MALTSKEPPVREVIHNLRTGEDGLLVKSIRREPTVAEIRGELSAFDPPYLEAVIVDVQRRGRAVRETWLAGEGLEVII